MLVPMAVRAVRGLFGFKPELTAFQLAPLLVERKAPPFQVPAKRLEPLTAKAVIFKFVKPELTAAQLVPLLVERKTPPPSVPAKRLVPLKTRAFTCLFVKLMLTEVQFA